jgi:uncharacterized protein (DUF1684 family)
MLDAVPDLTAALAVSDWRRRVHDLYRAVRADADPRAAHAAWVAGRDRLFGQHPATPLLPEHRRELGGLSVAPYDERYRFEAVVVQAGEGDGPDRFEARTGTDGVAPFERLGRVLLALPDGEVALDVWRLTTYGGGVFVPLRDGTCGDTTYGGGRYLLDTVKGADLGPGSRPESLVVDLNFAYPPSCAYDPAWACPLAPRGNTTSVPVPVGELHRGPWAH